MDFHLNQKKTGNRDATFADVEAQKDQKGFRDMYFMGTNLSTHFAEIFSFERTPRICVADAVRISMSIPLFFASHRSPRGDIYVDTLGVKTTEFKITEAKKKALVSSGRKGTETYFKWFDDPASEPANRV